MRWLVVVLASLDVLSSQPLTEQVSDGRVPFECCPCPGSERASHHLDALDSPQSTDSGLLGRETGVDDCACRIRDADPDGASSILIPRMLNPLRPDVKPENTNEDPKPLLHPEVDLASSVLETLRDATEEKYQESLARDAARNAARASGDSLGNHVNDPGEAVIVTNILSPKALEEEDIIISEASHVQESRCVHPLGISRNDLGHIRSTAPVLPTKGLVPLPKFKSQSFLNRPFYMHKSASNVEEKVVSANRGLESLKLRSSQSKLGEFLERAKSQIFETSNIDGNNKEFTYSKVPKFRLDSLSSKNKNEQTDSKPQENKLKDNPVQHRYLPKINLNKGKTTILESVSNLDSNISPSNLQEKNSETFSQEPEKHNLKSYLAKDLKKRPTNLKNILKLKDVHMFPTESTKTKINIPSMKLSPLSHDIIDNNEPRLTDPSCGQERNVEPSSPKILFNNEKTNISDADFSPSENRPTLIQTEALSTSDEEHISNDVPYSALSVIVADNSNESLESSNRSGESYEIFKDLDSYNENKNLDKHEEEFESSERETSFTSAEITQNSKEIAEIDSVELPREDYLQKEGDDHDSFVDASNDSFHSVPLEKNHAIEFEQKVGETSHKKNYGTAKLNPTKSNDIPTLQKNMLQKLEDLKADIKHIKNARQTYYLKSAERNEKDILQDAIVRDGFDTETKNTNSDISNFQGFIPTTEVNESSSSLDNLEQNFESLSKSSECTSTSKELQPSFEASEKMRIDDVDNPDINISGRSSEITILDSVNLPSNSQDISQTNEESDLFSGSTNQEVNDQLNSNESEEENICMADIDKNVEKKVEDSNVPKEMVSEASESIPNIVPQPSARQSIIVQPTALFGGNDLFRPLPGVPSLLNLDAHLPTVDEIRSSLSGILGIGARGTDVNDEISSEFHSDEDCSNAMSTGASTTSSKSVFPNRRPLEDINFDIFQLTPKSRKGLFHAPGLNLNSYKAKLALPQNLALKPLRLESSLGRNGNLLGATLTFGPERFGSSKSKMSRPSSIPDHAMVPTLGSTLSSLPNLDDIRTTIQSKAEDLLNSPLSIPPTHAIKRVNDLSENIKSHTKSTVKNIHQTLASTLSESRVKDIPLREKYAKPSPEDLIEKLSTARDDMSDKLKELHADLADRLSSIHENIAERSTLPTLKLPLFTQINKKPNSKFRTRPKNLHKPQNLSTSNMRSNKASTSNLQSSTRGINEIKVKPFKISKAASTLTPKTVEVPKLMTTSSKPPFARALHRDSNVKLKYSRPFESSMALDKKPVLRNKFTVSFPTTARPSIQNRPTFRPEFSSQRTTLRDQPAKDTFRNRPNLDSKSKLEDSRGFASEAQPARVPAPVRSDVTDRKDPIQTQITRSKPEHLFSNQNINKPTQITLPPTKSSNDQIGRSLTYKPLPKASDSPLLSKMRESLLGRQLSKAGSTDTNDYMARSATENRQKEIELEPLKENVKYRCRMVCVKEPID